MRCPNCNALASSLTYSPATFGANGVMIPAKTHCPQCEAKPADLLTPEERQQVETWRALGWYPVALAIIDRLAPPVRP